MPKKKGLKKFPKTTLTMISTHILVQYAAKYLTVSELNREKIKISFSDKLFNIKQYV